MTSDPLASTASDTTERQTPPPIAAWLPGVFLCWIGAWMVTDGGVDLGWAVGAFGLAMVLTGAVAQGVAWGMGIHQVRQR